MSHDIRRVSHDIQAGEDNPTRRENQQAVCIARHQDNVQTDTWLKGNVAEGLGESPIRCVTCPVFDIILVKRGSQV